MKTKKSTLRFAAIAALVGVLAMSGPASAVPASTAQDICGQCTNNQAACKTNTDCSGGATCGIPATCSVTQVYDITPGAILDFKTNTLSVTGAGQFNFDVNSGSILAGPISVSTANPAIKAFGTSNSGTDSGSIHIDARRLCSGQGNVPCVDLADCQLGACNTRRCSLKGIQHCTSDANCVGACVSRRCNNTQLFTRCTTNNDCNFGTCPEQLQCANRDVNPVNCSSNTDCSFGECSIGTASISMGGAIVGNSDFPASITLRAADNATVSKNVNLAGSAFDSDGGDLTVEAKAGFVVLSGTIVADSGGDGQGGSVSFEAGTDVTISADINVNGGDFDGGSVDIAAGRDAIINKSLFANANAGEGYGGEILLQADRDMTFNGISSFNRTEIETNGHTSADNSAGDGGSQDYSSGRDMSFTTFTRLIGNGATPNGYGSDFSVDVGRNLVMDGIMIAKSDGIHGQGGQLDVFADGTAKVGSTASIDLSGGDSGGGDLGFESTNNTDFAGTVDITGSTGGSGGTTFLYSSADTTLSGTLQATSLTGGDHEVDACRVTVTGTGKILSASSTNASNTITARESMKLLAGSQMKTAAGGTNELIYRSAAKPPITQGTITPAPIKTVDPTLDGCPVCGNLEVDQTETCDDGNTNNGDGCSSTCQNEKCIQQTVAPGYPTVPLCADSNNCTTDTCNTSLNGGTCQHAAKNCADAFPCTADSCAPDTGECLNIANHTLCNDNNDCTNDICSTTEGCTTVANSAQCDDDDNCTEDDICSNKTCSGTLIDGCSVCGNNVKTQDEQCDDGNASYSNGEYCGVGCVLIPCGKPTNGTGGLKASDALYVLRAAITPSMNCSIYVCDVDGNGSVKAADALRILKSSVQTPGLSANCPAPPA